MQKAIIHSHGNESILAKAIGGDIKGYGSIVLYAIAIPLSVYQEILAGGIYVLVALWWLIPERRIERTLEQHQS